MSTFYVNTTIINSGNTPAFTVAGGDELYLANDADIVATGATNNAINVTGSARVDIDGGVFGANGILISGADVTTTLSIGLAGAVKAHSENGVRVNVSGNSTVNIFNFGQITANDDGIELTGGVTRIWNYGVIAVKSDGTDNLGSGAVLEFHNAGSITTSSNSSGNATVYGGLGSDAVYNTGVISRSNGTLDAVRLEGGNDIFDGTGGRAFGTISGGSGNDILKGGLGADRLSGGSDNDELHFDMEDLTFGLIDGSLGYDTGVNTDQTTPFSINLTSQSLEAFLGSAADEVVVAGSLGGFGGFIRTGAGNDLVDGSGQADFIEGGIGVDVLYGRGGTDDLVGGLGGDWLQGGADADIFRYRSLTDSTVNGQDFIADFSTAEGDKIYLVEALSGLGPVTFNTGFGTGTSVYVFAGGGGTSLVQVYTGATLQMQIVASQAGLIQSDFVL
jgi:Ca2+-binding RTX toxin-like protein